MTRQMSELTTEELIDLFAAIALEQYDALLDDQYAKYKKLYAQMEALRDTLKNRPGDQRQALIPLLGHKNPQVRLKAAITLLAVAPDAATQTLQLISDRNEYPQAADARGMLKALEDGSYVPD